MGEWAGYQPVKRLRYKEDKHVLAFGPTGSGKSCALLVPNLANLLRSIVCVDPKGQLAAITARHRAKMGRVIVVNPFGVLLDRCEHLESAGFNPLAQLDPQSPNFTSQARAIAQALTDYGSGGKHGDFFDASAENILTAFCMWERIRNGKTASLRNVREDLASGALRGGVDEMIKSRHFSMRIIAKRLKDRFNPKAMSTSVEDVIDTIRGRFKIRAKSGHKPRKEAIGRCPGRRTFLDGSLVLVTR